MFVLKTKYFYVYKTNLYFGTQAVAYYCIIKILETLGAKFHMWKTVIINAEKYNNNNNFCFGEFDIDSIAGYSSVAYSTPRASKFLRKTNTWFYVIQRLDLVEICL